MKPKENKPFQDIDEPKPVYKKWWEKKDLNKKELSILVFGINPEAYSKFLDLDSKYSRTKEESEFLRKFNSHIESLEQYRDIWQIRDGISSLLENIEWKDKNSFIVDLYENGFGYLGVEINFEFQEFLKNSGLSDVFKYEKYKDFSLYKYDFKNFKNIKNSREIAAFALGVKEEYINKFIPIFNSLNKESYSKLKAEDKFFIRYYRLFIKKYFERNFLFPENQLIKVYEKISKFNFLSIESSIQNLWSKGYLLNENVLNFLSSKGIKHKSKTSPKWLELFKSKVSEAIWTEEEAYKIFIGIISDEVRLLDLRDTAALFSYLGKDYEGYEFNSSAMAYDSIKEEYFYVGELLKKHILAGDIKPVREIKVKNKIQYSFKVKDIFNWLLENTEYRPPEEFIDYINNVKLTKKAPLDNSLVLAIKGLTEAITGLSQKIENLEISKAIEKRNNSDDIHNKKIKKNEYQPSKSESERIDELMKMINFLKTLDSNLDFGKLFMQEEFFNHIITKCCPSMKALGYRGGARRELLKKAGIKFSKGNKSKDSKNFWSKFYNENKKKFDDYITSLKSTNSLNSEIA